jgi:hypothetical protein
MFINLLLTLLFCLQPLSGDESFFVEKLQQIIASSPNSSLPWPGFQLTRPLVITFEDGPIYGFQLKKPDSSWQKQGKHWYSPTDHWGIGNLPFSPFHPVGQEEVMLFHVGQPLSQEPSQALFILVHESFHLHQFAHFSTEAPSAGYRDHLNETNLALIEVEDAILAQFLLAKGDEWLQKEYLKDFVAVNRVRHALIEPASIQWERHQQLMEGLADYAAYRLLEDSAIPHSQSPVDGLTGYHANSSDYAIQGRHYDVGATLAMALDFLKLPHWRETTEKTGKSPGEWLREAIVLTPTETHQRLEMALLKYGYAHLQEQIDEEISHISSEIKTHLEAHQKGPGKIVRLGNLLTQGGAGGGSHSNSFHLPDGGTLSLNDTSTAISDDQSWQLSLVRIPHLIQEGPMRELRLDDATEISIDGHLMRLDALTASPRFHPFSSLRWKGKQGQFSSEGNAGTLEVDESGCVTILF